MKLAYHEAGHFIIASLFDNIKLNSLTIDKDYASKHDPNYNGALDMSFVVVPEPTDFESADNLLLIALASICAQTIYSKGQKYVSENFSKFRNDSNLLDKEGASGDMEIHNQYFEHIAQNYRIEKSHYTWSLFHWLFVTMNEPIIWDAIKLLAEHLYSSSNQALKNSAIENFMNSSNLTHNLALVRDKCLSTRYPLSANTIRNFAVRTHI